MSLLELSRAHRADLEVLTRSAANDLSILWREFTSGPEVHDGLVDVLPQLVEVYGSAAATLGADWYEDVREFAEAPGRFSAVVAELPDRSRTDALARWGVTPLFAAEPDPVTALSKVSGGLQRIVANADRGSVTLSSVADPQARGWKRVGRGGGCDWCRMLIGRGAVYSEATAHFDSHDSCHCTAVPEFG